MKRFFMKAAALLLTLTLVASLFVASAAADGETPADVLINKAATGTLTIHKYANIGVAPDYDKPQTNGPGDGYPVSSVPSYDALNGAHFNVYKVEDADFVVKYYNGNKDDAANVTVQSYIVNGAINGTKVNTNGDLVTAKVGDENGVIKLTGLPVGFYVVEEVSAPDQITNELCAPFLVSIPMVNASTGVATDSNHENWNYDVHAYPKNHESRGTLTVMKYGNKGTSPLSDVTFKLERKVGENSWETVTTYPKNDGTTGPVDGDTNAEVDHRAENENDSNTYKYVTMTGEDGKLVFNNLPSGLTGTVYRLTEVSAPKGYIVDTTPIEFTVKTNNTIEINWNNAKNNSSLILPDAENAKASKLETNQLTLALKNPEPSLDKQVYDANSNAENKWADDASFEMAETMKFMLTIELPHNVELLKTFIIEDTCDTGVAIKADSIKVLNAKDNSDLTSNFTKTTTANSFKIDCSAKMSALKNVEKILVTYDAILVNADADVFGDGNKNNATLTYSYTVGGTTDPTYTIEDEARVYTYDHNIFKTLEAGGDSTTPEGVQFQLYSSKAAGTAPIQLVNDGVSEETINNAAVSVAHYHVANPDESNTVVTMTTPDSGRISIRGLDDQTYYIKETATVNGYNLLSDMVEFKIGAGRNTTWTGEATAAFDDNGKKVMKTYGSTSYSPNEAATTSEILNRKGMVLPQTGSMGYLLFCSAGLVLVIAGAMLILSDRKRKIR